MGSEYLNDEYILVNVNNMGYEYNNEKQRDLYGKEERNNINKYGFDAENAFVQNDGYAYQEYKLIENFIDRHHYIISCIFLILFIIVISYV